MHTQLTLLCLVVYLVAFLGSGAAIAFSPGKTNTTVRFIPNKGQWANNVRYKARIPGGQLFITDRSLTYHFWDQKQLSRYHHKKDSGNKIKAHVLKMQLKDANPAVSIQSSNPTDHQFNFFKGKDQENWVTGLKGYQTIRLENVYPGIDMVLKGLPKGVKYNFIVDKQADPGNIRMNWQGAEDLSKKNGQLRAETSLQPLIENQPVAYTLSAKGKRKAKVNCRFNLVGNDVQFNFKDQVPANQKLLIDPEIIFATFSGSYADNFGFTGTFDSSGHAYSGGTVYGSGFPTTTGAFLMDFLGGKDVNGRIGDIERDAGILKYSEDGSNLLYATYLGGSHNEQPHSMIVNSKQELLIFGTSFSEDFPRDSNSYQNRHRGESDAYIVKLSPDGSRLVSGTLLGGSDRDGLNGKYLGDPNGGYRNKTKLGYNYGDLYRGEIMVDSQDRVYIASSTQSENFPTTGNAYKSNFSGGYQDGFVAKLSENLDQLKWSTYIGGGLADAAYSVKVNQQGQVYITGGTRSRNLNAMSNGWQSIAKNGIDGYLLKLSADGRQALAGTYIGTNEFDQAYFVEINRGNGVYVTGQTEGDMPIKNSNYVDPNSGQFISKFSQDLSQLELSTVFGSGSGTPDLSPSAFLVDVCGNIYVSGWGGATNRTSHSEADLLLNMPLTEDAYQTNTDGSDFYLAVFRSGMDSLLYASYLGGPKSDEHVDGGTSRFDKRGMVYQSVCGGCHGNSDFPVTENAYSKTNNARFGCNNAFLKLKLDVANKAPLVNKNTSGAKDFIKVKAGDTLRHPLPIDDPENDSVYIKGKGEAFSSKDGEIDPAKIEKTKGKPPFKGNLVWPIKCEQVGDTFELYIAGKDNGCPSPRSDKDTIQVYVDSLPKKVETPQYCTQIINSNTMMLSWDTIQNEPTISHYELMRINPNGDTIFLDSINPPNQRSFEDQTAFNLKEKRYCYYLRVINLCGRKVSQTYKICTGPEYQDQPDPLGVRQVTVVNNKHLKISWPESNNKDFAKYRLLRKHKDSPDQDFQVYKTFDKVTDTSFVDKEVNVAEQSYCYRLRVEDVCEFFSDKSYRGCNMVLSGESEPFEHSMDWNPYKNWPNGINYFKVFRKDPLIDTTFKPIARLLPDKINYLDNELNYDVGAYWYKIKAYEKAAVGKPGKSTHSQSNTIYLEQKPLLHVPSAFTINQDGLNEVWGLKPVFVKNIHVMVFNRWGEKVYETKDLEDQWDGPGASSYPEKMSDNVYIYRILYNGWDGIQRSKTGDVTILK